MDPNQIDEIHLTGTTSTEEESKSTAAAASSFNVEEEKKDKKSHLKAPFKSPMSRETVQAYSRWLHRNTPENHYFRVKIPWRTIVVAFIFLIVGTILLYFGIQELMTEGSSEAWEKIVLGLVLFIPGSFHSFLAVQALRGAPGYDYEHLTTFESEKYFEED